MKIIIEQRNGQLVERSTLADDLTARVQNFRIDGGRIIQPTQLFRADDQAFYNRKNRTTQVSFDVQIEHDDIQAAEVYVLENAAGLIADGTVIFSATAESGNVVQRFLIGIIETTSASYIGVTTRHSYRINGGSILKTRP